MQVTTLEYDNYKGQIGVGRLRAGVLKRGMPIVRITPDGQRTAGRLEYLFTYHNLERLEVETAQAGDIVAIAGPETISISDTIADPAVTAPLSQISVEQPTVRMTFGVNTSPFAGREGKAGWGTSRRLRERLYNEMRSNVALRVEDGSTPDRFIVSGRGELHLAILIETMRREGYEFEVSRPEVLIREGADGELLEPYEEVYIDTTPDTVGVVMDMLGTRRGQLLDMTEERDGSTRLVYLAPTRGLLGFRYHFITATRGLGVMHPMFHGYLPLAGPLPGRPNGSLVSFETGVTSSYGLANAEERGVLFVGPNVEVYEGMVVGEHQRPGDLAVNVCKKKHLTNMRTSTRDIDIRLTPPRAMSLDESIEYLADDELLEVTPLNLRLRKRILDRHDRGREAKRAREALGI